MKFFSLVFVILALAMSVSATYLTGTKGGALPATKGAAPLPPAKGQALPPAKGGSLKGLIKPMPAKPIYQAPTKTVKAPLPVEQKIEQVVQQEEELVPVEQQKVEQELESKGKKVLLNQQPQRIGIIKWEQRIEQPKQTYKPRKSIYRPQVQQVQQQLEEDLVQQKVEQQVEQQIEQQVEQKVEQKIEQRPLVQRPLAQRPLAQKPLYTQPKLQQKPIYQNVRQIPTTFNTDAGWD